MKTALKTMALVAALTLAWGCATSGSDDNEEGGLTTTASFQQSERPRWAVDMSSDQQRPQWEAPDPSRFENKMIVLLRLEDYLVPYSTDDDLMAVFVGDECRALSVRSGNDEKVYFVLNIHGNTSVISEHYQLNYYSGGLKQLFCLSGFNIFSSERIIGIDVEFSPTLSAGQTKFAVSTQLTVDCPNRDGHPVDADKDMLAVFVGGECRGVGKPGQPFYVYSDTTGEEGVLRYYSGADAGIYTNIAKVQLTGEPQGVTFVF